MPGMNVTSPKQDRVNFKEVNADYDYTYPESLDLKPGSDQHEELKNLIIQRARVSHDMMQNRFKSWNSVEDVLTAYIYQDDSEKELKDLDARRPTSIVFPYSYAMLETLLTYLFVALARDPIFMYEGVSPEDTPGAMMLELIVQQHCVKNKVALALHTMLRDSLVYGFGVVTPNWKVQRGKRKIQGKDSANVGGQIIETPFGETVDAVLFEGNELKNIEPYKFLPDPNVAIHNVHTGEFVGWVYRTNLNNMLRDEESDEDLFNGQYLKHLKTKTSQFGEEESSREFKTGMQRDKTTGMQETIIDVIPMYIDLIPEEYGLSGRTSPEVWKFQLAGDEVIIEAAPANFNHGMLPVAAISPDFDGYSLAPMSRMEMLYGLQGVLDFLFNSHIANVRKAVNDMFVVDPQLVNINDMKDPKPGKLIRLRRPAWGRGVKDVVHQLQVNDVTRMNVPDYSYVMDAMGKEMGVDSAAMGSLRKGGPERLTGQEFQGTRQGALNRMERIAKVVGLQGFQDIAYQFASNTQQMMSEETYVKAIGRSKDDILKQFGAQVQDGRLKVSPFDLLIEYDVFARDGSIPGGNYSAAQLELFKVIAQDEELRQGFDIFRIFSQIAVGAGFKNVEDFKRQTPTQVMPDAQVQSQVQAGNLRPIGGVS